MNVLRAAAVAPAIPADWATQPPPPAHLHALAHQQFPTCTPAPALTLSHDLFHSDTGFSYAQVYYVDA